MKFDFFLKINLMVKIDAFVEVSAKRLRNLHPSSPHGSFIDKNFNKKNKKVNKNYFYTKSFTVISYGKLTINGKLSLIAKLSK